MKGADWGGFVHPEDRDRMGAHLARALEGTEPAVADYRIIAADGTARWLSYAGQIQRTSDGDRMLGTVVDITDRKRLEAELRHHATEVERILESIGEGFVAFDRDFRYIYVNPPAANMLGRTREELVGRIPWEIFPEETTKDSKRILETALLNGVPTQYRNPRRSLEPVVRESRVPLGGRSDDLLRGYHGSQAGGGGAATEPRCVDAGDARWIDGRMVAECRDE